MSTEATMSTAAAMSTETAAKTQTLQQRNIKRVQELVHEYMQGNPEGYLAGLADDFKGSVLGGLIPGGDDIQSKAAFKELMETMGEHMEVKKFQPCNFRAVGDDVLFNVDWIFVVEGKTIETTALVRKVVKNNMLCEKYHMLDHEVLEALNKPLPHDLTAMKRVQELLDLYSAGDAAGYMAGVSDDFKGSVLGGLIPDADDMKSKADFEAAMTRMPEYMEVKQFQPKNFRALPDDSMMFNVDWEFVWKPTGKTVQTTALVRKVVKDNMICEKYHCVAADEITGEPSPRAVTETA